MFSKLKEKRTLITKWQSLLQSQNEEQEITNIKELTAFVRLREGHCAVLGTKANGSEVNMAIYGGSLKDIVGVRVSFFWHGKSWQGENWQPINVENLFEFFYK